MRWTRNLPLARIQPSQRAVRHVIIELNQEHRRTHCCNSLDHLSHIAQLVFLACRIHIGKLGRNSSSSPSWRNPLTSPEADLVLMSAYRESNIRSWWTLPHRLGWCSWFVRNFITQLFWISFAILRVLLYRYQNAYFSHTYCSFENMSNQLFALTHLKRCLPDHV